MNDVEVPLPRNVIRLQDCDPLGHRCAHSSALSRLLGMPALLVSAARYPVSASASLRMSAPAPMMQLRPIVTCSRIVALTPMKQFGPIFAPPDTVTCEAMKQLSAIST